MKRTGSAADEREARRERLLGGLGRAVRERRIELGLTREGLAASSGVSARYLAALEAGVGNISIARLADLAAALATRPAALLDAGEELQPVRSTRQVVALLGIRGAGKSTLGPLLARQLDVPFVELDQLVEVAGGMSVGQIFELHGEGYFRRLERETLARFLGDTGRAVLATGGGIVTHPSSFELLQRHTVTVWLRAAARDHWSRVVAQGDRRPMADRKEAMGELQSLLEGRAPLYARAALVIDTSDRSIQKSAEELAERLAGLSGGGARGR